MYSVLLMTMSSILIIYVFLPLDLVLSFQPFHVSLPCNELEERMFCQEVQLNWTLAKKGKQYAFCGALFSSPGICNSHRYISQNHCHYQIIFDRHDILYIWIVGLIVCEYHTPPMCLLPSCFLNNNHVLHREASRCFIACQHVISARPQIKVSWDIKNDMYIMNSSHCLIYNVLLHNLIRFGSRNWNPHDLK